jgi:hypothetical protein
VDIVAAGDLGTRFLAFLAPFNRFAPLLRGQLRFPAELHAAPLRALSAFAGAGTD